MAVGVLFLLTRLYNVAFLWNRIWIYNIYIYTVYIVHIFIFNVYYIYCIKCKIYIIYIQLMYSLSTDSSETDCLRWKCGLEESINVHVQHISHITSSKISPCLDKQTSITVSELLSKMMDSPVLCHVFWRRVAPPVFQLAKAPVKWVLRMRQAAFSRQRSKKGRPNLRIFDVKHINHQSIRILYGNTGLATIITKQENRKHIIDWKKYVSPNNLKNLQEFFTDGWVQLSIQCPAFMPHPSPLVQRCHLS